ncbi:MAG: transporter [Tardiphaga sp.]|nr:transporter [Tardiphaga sp.]
MIGNFVTGIALLGPTAMLTELSSGLGVTIREAGLLITFGAMVLCVGSPVTAWLTSRIERRHLLMGAVAVIAAANFGSAFATNYAALLVIRLLMAAVAALYTPQAAGTVALIVPLERRGGSIAYVFLGWTLAAAVGLPLVTFVASRYGWRAVYGGIGALSCLSFLLLAWRLPRGLYGTPVDLKTWIDLARNRLVVVLLLVTTLQISGQFVIFTFLAPLLGQLTGAGPDAASAVFAIYGLSGLAGIMTATRIVDGWGAFNTSLLATTLVLSGMTVWSLGAGSLPVMAIGVAVWGMGFGATNSMQQVRLVGAAPAAASASVSLNTSVLYVGQAIGSAIGGLLFAGGHFHASGFVAMGFLALALLAVAVSRSVARPARRS